MSKHKDGLFVGKSHKEGGIPMVVKSTGQKIEVEGGESITNKTSMADTEIRTLTGTNCEIISQINTQNGNGVAMDCDSVVGKKYEYKDGGGVKDNFEFNEDFKIDKELVFQDFNTIKKSGLFNNVYFAEDKIEIVGGQYEWINDQQYNNSWYQEKFGKFFTINDIMAELKKINNRNYAYRVDGEKIESELEYDEYDGWDKYPTETMYFYLVPTKLKNKAKNYKTGGWILVNANTERIIKEYETESEARQMMYEYDGDSFVMKKSELEKEKLKKTYREPAPFNPATYIGMKKGGQVSAKEIEDWRKYVLDNSSWFDNESDDSVEITLTTRENGDTYNEQVGQKDIDEAKNIYKKIISKFPKTQGKIERVDEYVYLYLKPSKSNEELEEEKRIETTQNQEQKSAKIISEKLNFSKEKAFDVVERLRYSKQYYEQYKNEKADRYNNSFRVYFQEGTPSNIKFNNAEEVFDYITKDDFIKSIYNRSNPRNKVQIGLYGWDSLLIKYDNDGFGVLENGKTDWSKRTKILQIFPYIESNIENQEDFINKVKKAISEFILCYKIYVLNDYQESEVILKKLDQMQKYANGGSVSNFLSTRSEMFNDDGKKLSKSELQNFLDLTKKSDFKYWINGANGYHVYSYKGQLRSNDSTSGIFDATIIYLHNIKDDFFPVKIHEEELSKREKEVIYRNSDEFKNKNKNNVWYNVLKKFFLIFYGQYEYNTAEDYIDESQVTTDEVKARGSNPYPHSWEFRNFSPLLSWKEAKDKFKQSLTKEELDSIEISFNSEDYADAEEHDTEKTYNTLTIKKNEKQVIEKPIDATKELSKMPLSDIVLPDMKSNIDKKIRGLKIALKFAIKGEKELIEKKIKAFQIAKKMDKYKTGGGVAENEIKVGQVYLHTETNEEIIISKIEDGTNEPFVQYHTNIQNPKIDDFNWERISFFENLIDNGSFVLVKKYANGGIVSYDINWEDENGDEYSESFDTIEEVNDLIKNIKKNGGRIIEKLKYIDNDFKGYFKDGGSVKNNFYKKFGDDNLHLVKFDLSALDDYEEMQFNHFSKSSSKAESLQILINNVEGDYSQLSPTLSKIAEEQYPSDEFFEENRQYVKGGSVDFVNTEVMLTENKPNGLKWRGIVKPFMLKSIEDNQYSGGFKRYEIDIYDQVDIEPTKESIEKANEFFDKVGGRYSKGGGIMSDDISEDDEWYVMINYYEPNAKEDRFGNRLTYWRKTFNVRASSKEESIKKATDLFNSVKANKNRQIESIKPTNMTTLKKIVKEKYPRNWKKLKDGGSVVYSNLDLNTNRNIISKAIEFISGTGVDAESMTLEGKEIRFKYRTSNTYTTISQKLISDTISTHRKSLELRGKNFAIGGRVKVGVFNENQLRNKEDKKAVEKAQKETGLNYTDTKIIKKAGQMFLEVYLIPNEEYYNSSKFNKGGAVEKITQAEWLNQNFKEAVNHIIEIHKRVKLKSGNELLLLKKESGWGIAKYNPKTKKELEWYRYADKEIANYWIDKVDVDKYSDGGSIENKIGGNYSMKNEFGSFTSIKIMPVDKNLRGSNDFFSVQISIRIKEGDLERIQIKPIVTFPMSKYDSFIEDLNNRNATKYKNGGEVYNFSDYSNDALSDMIINLSRYENNEEYIEIVKAELKKRKNKNISIKKINK